MGGLTFFSRRSTLVVIFLRIGLILLPHIFVSGILPQEWLYSEALKSILVRPHSTLSHVREAQAVRDLATGRFSDAYNPSESIQAPPLVLAAIMPLLDTKYPGLYLSILVLLVDILIAYMLEAIGTLALSAPDREKEEEVQIPEAIQPPYSHIFPVKQQQSSDPLLPLESLPGFSSMLYFCSPFVAMPGDIFCCYQNISTLFLVTAIFECIRPSGSKSLSTLSLAAAAYIEPHNVVFLIPVSILSFNRLSGSPSFWNCAIPLILFLVWSCFIQGLAYTLLGSPTKFASVVATTYGCGWKNMSPNLSVQWYFHMQLFSRFRDYFGALILGLPYAVLAPLTIRLCKYPMELVAILSLIWTIFRPVETLFDFNLSLCFLLFCPKSLARMEKLSFVALCSIWVPVSLYLVDYWMWLEPGTGNANYIFFQCLAFNIFLGIILGQFCSACVQRDKALKLARKEESRQTEGENQNRH